VGDRLCMPPSLPRNANGGRRRDRVHNNATQAQRARWVARRDPITVRWPLTRYRNPASVAREARRVCVAGPATPRLSAQLGA
jgi:hypothetical protein